ncbi:hypothetical protein HDU98_008967 [Podochytrium sp. JEL0797]|nr:hypothetical protein HDU98_008967 [Podochytrium sp. JEL0797]
MTLEETAPALPTTAEASFPVDTNHQTLLVNGVSTDIVCMRFAERKVFVVVSQVGKIGGTVIEASYDRTASKYTDQNDHAAFSQTCSISTLLGSRSDPLVHAYGSHLLDVVTNAVGSGARLVLSLALKPMAEEGDGEEEGVRLRAVAGAVGELLK